MYSSNFENFALPYGGVLTLNDEFKKAIFGGILSAVNNYIIDEWNDLKNKQGNSLYIDCGYINNNTQNAIASKYNETYTVAIYEGMVRQLFNVFFGYLSYPKILTDIGNPESETIKFDWKILNGIPQIKPFKDGPLIPNDPERAKIAWLLYKISLSYVFFHEIGHICCGHTDYLNVNYSIDEISEKIQTNRNELNDIISSFEIDADIFSGSIIFSFLKHELTGVLDVNLSNPLPLDKRLSLMFFSIGTVLRIFQYISPRKDFFQITTHPTPVIRFFALFMNFLYALKKENEISSDVYDKVIENTIVWLAEVDKVFQPPDSVNEWFANGKELLSFSNKIGKKTIKLYKELCDYEFIPPRKLLWQEAII